MFRRERVQQVVLLFHHRFRSEGGQHRRAMWLPVPFIVVLGGVSTKGKALIFCWRLRN